MSKTDPKDKVPESPRPERSAGPSHVETAKVKLGAIAGDKREVKGEKVTARSHIKLDILQSGDFIDKPNLQRIEQLDVNESAEKQKANFYELAGTTIFELIPHLIRSGINIDSIRTFDVFRKPPTNIDNILNISANARGNADLHAAFNKIREILEKGSDGPDGTRTILNEGWNEIVVRAEHVSKAQKILMEEGAKNPAAIAKAVSPKEKGFFEKHSSELIYSAVGIGLLVGAYFTIDKIIEKFSKDEGKDGKKEKSGFWGKLFTGFGAIGMLAGAGFGIGRLSEIETVRALLKLIHIDDAKIIVAARLFSHGEISKAWETLTNGQENQALHEKVIERIQAELGVKINPGTLTKIGGVKYKDLTSAFSKGKTMLADLFEVPGFLSREEEQEITTIRTYLQNHKNEIGQDTDTLTVDEVLGKIVGIRPSTAGIESDLKNQDPDREKAIAKVQDVEKKTFLLRIERDVFMPLREMVNQKTVNGYIAYAQRYHRDTGPLERLWAHKEELEKQYNNLITANGSETALNSAAGEIAEEIQKIFAEMEEIGKKTDWQEELKQLSPQFFNFVRRYYLDRSGIAFGTYMLGKILKAPLRMAVRSVPEEWRNPKLDTTAKNAALQKELDGLKPRQNLDSIADPQLKLEAGKNNAYRDFLENEKNILTQESASAKAKSGGRADVIAIEEAKLDALKRQRITLLEKRISADWADSKKRFFEAPESGAARKGVLQAEHYNEMDRLSGDYARLEREIDEMVLERAQKLEALHKAGKGKDAKEVQALIEEINQLNASKLPKFSKVLNRFETVVLWWKTRWAALTGGNIELAARDVDPKIQFNEKTRMQEWMGKVFRGNAEAVSAAKDTGLRSTLKTMGGRLIVYVPLIALGGYLNKDEATDTKTAVKQAAVDVLPFSGTYSDWYSVFTGRELVTQRKIGGWDKALRGVFGTAGLVCDIATLAGIGLFGRGALAGLRAGKGAMEAVRVGREARRVAETGRTLRTAGKLGRKLQFVGLAGALGAMGYSIIMKPNEVPVPKATGELLREMPDIGPAPVANDGVIAPPDKK